MAVNEQGFLRYMQTRYGNRIPKGLTIRQVMEDYKKEAERDDRVASVLRNARTTRGGGVRPEARPMNQYEGQ